MTTKLKIFNVVSHGRSDTGLVREDNEDAWLVEPTNNVFVLCDGMGGHSAGEVASQEAVKLFSCLVKKYLGKEIKGKRQKQPEILKRLIQEVNASIYSLGKKDRDLRGMGTTLCCVYFQAEKMLVGHVGDSRVYLFRNHKLNQLTKDHSLVTELIELGELNQRQAGEYHHRNIITKAIGADGVVDPSVRIVNLAAKDQILMCSDGLTDMLAKKEIETILNQGTSLEQTVDHLIEKANHRGGHDNITTILLRLQEGSGEK